MTAKEKIQKIEQIIAKWGIGSMDQLYQSEKFALEYAEIIGEICDVVGWHNEEE